MFKYKIELVALDGRNYQAFENHFQEMAQKGWFVYKFFNNVIIYKKGDPQFATYCFDYNERSKRMDGVKYKTNVEYQDFIEESHYEFVDHYGKYNLFMTKDPHAKSLHSDEIMFYKTMIKGNSFNYVALVLLILAAFVLMNTNLFGFKFYLSWTEFIKPFVWFIFLITSFVMIINEIIENHKANKLLQMNILPKPDSFKKIRLSGTIICIAMLFSAISYIGIFSSSLFIIYFIGLPIILAILSYNRLSHTQNSFVYFVLCFIVLGCIYFYVDKSRQSIVPQLQFERERNVSMEYENTSSPLVNQYILIHQYSKSNPQPDEENVLIEEFFDCKSEWMANKVYTKMIENYPVNSNEYLNYDNVDSVYYSQSHHHLVARKVNQILHLYFEHPDKHDLNAIFDAYFN